MRQEEFVKSWFDNKEANHVVTRHVCGKNMSADDDSIYSYGRHFPLVIKCKNGFVLNGNKYSSSTSAHQSLVIMACERRKSNFAVVPYSVLDLARIQPESIEIISKEEEHYRKIKYKNAEGNIEEREEHLLGGSLLRVRDRSYLSGTDSSAHLGRGYFLTELRTNPETVQEAIEALKPEIVRQYESAYTEDERDLDGLLRQGEWFFIKVNSEAFIEALKKTTNKKIKDIEIRTPFLPRVNDSIPHHQVTRMIYLGNDIMSDVELHLDSTFVAPMLMFRSGFYCKGCVRHNEGDHRLLRLGDKKTWYHAVPNTQVASYTFGLGRGRVD